MDGRIDDFDEVVRWDVRGHADGDAARAIDEEIWKARRQDHRLVAGPVEVRLKPDRVALDVGEKVDRDASETALGVPVGGRRIAVDGAEVALSVDEHVAHAEALRHANERVVDAGITVWMKASEHLADDERAFSVRAARREVQAAHGVE